MIGFATLLSFRMVYTIGDIPRPVTIGRSDSGNQPQVKALFFWLVTEINYI